MSYENGKWWPAAYRPRETWTHAYRTLDEAGIERFDDKRTHGLELFAWGICIGILVGMALIDLMEAMA